MKVVQRAPCPRSYARTRARALTVPRAAAASQPAVLITGSSTGIGKETAIYLSKKGWDVFAGVRKESDGEALVREAPSIVPLILDVTSDESTAAAVEEVARRLGDGRNLNGLVNNAGMGIFMPLELISMEDFDRVLAVNVSGVVRVTKAALPLLRKNRPDQQPGRIVNIGSYAGTIAIPLFGAYAASKFGLEAVSDVMRYELGPKWGIRTVLIKAGGVKTPIWEKSISGSVTALAAADPAVLAPYKEMCDEVFEISRQAEANGITAAEVAAKIEEALTVADPRARYLIGNNAARDMTIRRLLPDTIWDKFMMMLVKSTGVKPE